MIKVKVLKFVGVSVFTGLILISFQNCNPTTFSQPPEPVEFKSVAVPEMQGVFSAAQNFQSNYWKLHGANKNFKVNVQGNELLEKVLISLSAAGHPGCTVEHVLTKADKSQTDFDVDIDCWLPVGEVTLNMTSTLSDGRSMNSSERLVNIDQIQLKEIGPTVVDYQSPEAVALMPTMVLRRTPVIKLNTLPVSLAGHTLIAILKDSSGVEICRGQFSARTDLQFRHGNPMSGVVSGGGMVDCRLSVSENNELEIQAWTADQSVLLNVMKSKFKVIAPQLQVLSISRGVCNASEGPALFGNGSLAPLVLPDDGMFGNHSICAKVKIPVSYLENTDGIFTRSFVIGAVLGGPNTGWSQTARADIHRMSQLIPVADEPDTYKINTFDASSNSSLIGYVMYFSFGQLVQSGSFSALSNAVWFYVGAPVPNERYTPASFWQN